MIVAERQSAGRGRLDRAWQSPPRAGIAVSVLLRPRDVPPARYGKQPQHTKKTHTETVRRVAEVDAYLKWPNDLLLTGDRKCAGILAESVAGEGDPAVVLGIGLNTHLRADELPRPDATSLALAGAAVHDRDPLLRQLLRGLSVWYGRWAEAGGHPVESGLREAYLFHSGTIGRRVQVELPDGALLEGVAADIDDDGRLLVTTADGAHPIADGDVVHLR